MMIMMTNKIAIENRDGRVGRSSENRGFQTTLRARLIFGAGRQWLAVVVHSASALKKGPKTTFGTVLWREPLGTYARLLE